MEDILDPLVEPEDHQDEKHQADEPGEEGAVQYSHLALFNKKNSSPMPEFWLIFLCKTISRLLLTNGHVFDS